MSIFNDLLFLHGHIANVELARQLAGAKVAPPEAASPGQREAVEQDRPQAPTTTTRREVDITSAACTHR
ncbi:hypothetical protein D3C81_849880 [compost metagenome]